MEVLNLSYNGHSSPAPKEWEELEEIKKNRPTEPFTKLMRIYDTNVVVWNSSQNGLYWKNDSDLFLVKE